MVKTTIAFLAFISWTLFLLILMEAIRTYLVMSKQVAATKFVPGNENLSPFMQRLARAHLNCVEGLPVFGGLMLVAIVTSKTSITDPLSLWFLLARIVQSCVHLLSVEAMAINIRFTLFAVQMVIGVIWAWNLFAALA
jgi:uncharacterized MAPEG superfamily protein